MTNLKDLLTLLQVTYGAYLAVIITILLLLILLIIGLARILFFRKPKGSKQYQSYKKDYDAYMKEKKQAQRKKNLVRIIPVLVVLLLLAGTGGFVLVKNGTLSIPSFIGQFGAVGHSVGDTVKSNGVEFTLIEAVESEGNDFLSPDDEKVFLVLNFDVTNNSKDEININPLTSYSAYADDYKVDMSVFGTITLPELESDGVLSGSVPPGKKLKGGVCFSIPKDWKRFEINIAPDWLNEKDVVFTVEK